MAGIASWGHIDQISATANGLIFCRYHRLLLWTCHTPIYRHHEVRNGIFTGDYSGADNDGEFQDGCAGSNDQWILMAHVEFEISSDDGGEFGCGEDCGPDDRCFAAVSASRGDNIAGLLLGGALWAQSLDFRGENLRSDLHWLYLAMADLYSSPC
jgi:hypothetical protein